MNKIAEIKVSYNRQKIGHKVRSSLDAYQILLKHWNKRTLELQEEFKILLLNNTNEVLGVYSMSKGGLTGTVVDIRLIFSVALKCNATAIILSHNHPSGTLVSSDADKQLTRKVKAAGDLLDIKVLDHIIVTKTSYTSLADTAEM